MGQHPNCIFLAPLSLYIRRQHGGARRYRCFTRGTVLVGSHIELGVGKQSSCIHNCWDCRGYHQCGSNLLFLRSEGRRVISAFRKEKEQERTAERKERRGSWHCSSTSKCRDRRRTARDQ